MTNYLRQLANAMAGPMAVLVLALAWATNGRASCGDYLHAPVSARDFNQSSTPVPAPPCSGPSCERHRDAPLAPPAADQPTRLEAARVSESFCLPITTPGSQDLAASLTVTPEPISTEIFHPPR